MPLTGNLLGQVLDSVGARGGQIDTLDRLALGADAAFRAAGANTRYRCAGMLSQMMQESAWLRTTREYSRGKNAPYWPYYGRTFMQLTWRGNYQRFGAWAFNRHLVTDPNVFVQRPDDLADLRWAWLGGVFYFTGPMWGGKNLLQICDGGSIMQISNAVNRGDPYDPHPPLGFRTRKAAWDAALALGNKILPVVDAPSRDENRPRLVVDGVFGVNTAKVLQTILREDYRASGADGKPLALDGDWGANSATALERVVNLTASRHRWPVAPLTGLTRPHYAMSTHTIRLRWMLGAQPYRAGWDAELTRRLQIRVNERGTL